MNLSKKHLPSVKTGHFKHTAACETQVMPIPDVVKISMSQHIGAPCKPLVKRGDHVDVGQLIGDTDAFVSAPIHSSVSGKVEKIEEQRSASGGVDVLVSIATDKEQTPFAEIEKPKAENLEEFVQAIKKSGLVGLGGAAFPTFIKLNPRNLADVHTLIINAAECEPYITSDHRLMLEDADDLLNGMLLTMKYLGLDEGYIGIEENKMDAIKHLDELIAKRNLSNIKTFRLLSRYPKGAERVLVYEITGKTMNAGVLPADLGIILSNVATIAFVGQYFDTGMPLISKRITIDGDAVTNPGNIIAPIGASINDVMKFCGGYKAEPKKILMGGPMMGRAIYSDATPVIKNNNAILAFSTNKAIIPEETACINCGRCHDACPFGLLPTGLADAYDARDAEKLNKLKVMQCMECGSCSYICPARRPLGFINKLGKAVVREAGIK